MEVTSAGRFRLLKNEKNETGRAYNIGIGGYLYFSLMRIFKSRRDFFGVFEVFFGAICTSQYSRQEKKLCEKESGHILKIHSIFF